MKRTKIIGFTLTLALSLGGILQVTNANSIEHIKVVKNNVLLANKSEWSLKNGVWSYLENGQAVTGWQQIDGSWYCFNKTGQMQTGWIYSNGSWYYLNASGAMQTGWQQINGKWYYLNTSGAMQTNWQLINGTWYYFDNSGVMQVGTLSEGNELYYLNSTGAMQTGWGNINNQWYYFNNEGVMQTGWLNLDNTKYYLNKSGIMETGWQKINGNWYDFTSEGNINPDVQSTPVKYNMTMQKYVAGEVKEYEASIRKKSLTKSQVDELKNTINPADSPDVYEFLNVAQYRDVNKQALANALQGQGVLSGHAQDFINAGKEYNIDPVYLMAKTFLESGRGTSNFAQGIEITEVENSNGQIVKLKQPVKVYNLYGIGAYNSNATLGATSYAYYHGWTSVSKAIYGAAEFLSNQYMHNPNIIAQDTPYEIRYINGPTGDMWHQYSTQIQYPQTIGELIDQYSNIYSANDKFNFQIPTFNKAQNNN